MKKKSLILVIILISLVLASNSLLAMSSSPEEEEWEWKTSTPEEQGIDSGALLVALNQIERENIDLNSLLVIRNGDIVTEVYYPPHGKEDSANLYSATKSVLSVLIGIALEEEYLESVDQRVYDFFPEYYSEDMDSNKKEITIENLLTMTAGYDVSLYYDIDSEATILEQIIKRPLINEVGEKFVYDNLSSDLLAVILTEATDMTVIDFANKYLFQAMGINDFQWANLSANLEYDSNYYGGAAGVYLKPRDMAKFGYLFLNKGYWEGEEIVPEAWVNKSTQKHIFEEDWNEGYSYGYQWWVTEYGYYAHGMGEQYIMVIPESDMVIVSSAKTNKFHNMYNLFSRIRKSVKDNQAREENLQASRELEKRITDIKNLQPKEVISLPQKADEISGDFYKLEPNDLEIEGLSLEFEDENTAYLKLEGPSISDDAIEIGLDGIYRKTEITNDYRFHLYDLNVDVVAARGEWSGENTFNLEIREMGNFKYDFSFIFSDEQLTGTLNTAPLDILDFLSGEVEN